MQREGIYCVKVQLVHSSLGLLDYTEKNVEIKEHCESHEEP